MTTLPSLRRVRPGRRAAVLMRVLESMLFGVTSHDPATFMTAPLLLVTVALAACAIPAWRAANIDPVTVLRSD